MPVTSIMAHRTPTEPYSSSPSATDMSADGTSLLPVCAVHRTTRAPAGPWERPQREQLWLRYHRFTVL